MAVNPRHDRDRQGVFTIARTSSPTAIVVDDQRWLASALAERLSLDGFQSVVAGSAAEALSVFDNQAYDVAFIDLALPDGNGIDLAGEFKKRQPQLMVVLITGFAASRDDPSLGSTSVDVVLPKPWAPRELESIIRRVRDTQ